MLTLPRPVTLKQVRDQIRSSVTGVVDRLKESTNPSQLRASTREVDSLYEKIQGLVPKDDRQRSVQARALGILISLQETRWLMYEQESTSISLPMLIILLSWLTTLFISSGLFAPANGTAITTLSVSALSVSGAILLILELYTPYQGLIKISNAPLGAALTQLGN
jgi:membrane-bound ClpP family serine protease